VKNIKFLILTQCFVGQVLGGIASIVYNIKIAETTKRQAFDYHFKNPTMTIGTLFDQYRKKWDGTQQNFGGGLATLLYVNKSYYAKVDWAVAQTSETKEKSHFSQTQTDDLLFTSGCSYPVTKQIKLTFSGLLGFPTHKDASLEHAQLGYGHVGLGAQMDGSFIYSAHHNHSLRPAARYVRFFQRDAKLIIDGQKKDFKFNFGNLVDLYIAHHSKFAPHSLEFGYDATFLFGTKICPHQDDIAHKNNYIRSSFYLSYDYHFFIKTLPSAIAANFSYGFDQIPKKAGNKRIVTLWTSLTINF